MNSVAALQKLNLSPEVWSLIQRGLSHAGLYQGTFQGSPSQLTFKALEKFFSGGKTQEDKSARLIAAIRSRAASKIGVREHGSNTGPDVLVFQRATWLDGTGWAWCAAFVCWVIREAAKDVGGVPWELPRTAGAWDFENWAKKQSSKVRLLSVGTILAGDIVIFVFSHIGIAYENQSGGNVTTIEGNTNGSGSREGDGVYKKVRSRGQIRSFIRLSC